MLGTDETEFDSFDIGGTITSICVSYRDSICACHKDISGISFITEEGDRFDVGPFDGGPEEILDLDEVCTRDKRYTPKVKLTCICEIRTSRFYTGLSGLEAHVSSVIPEPPSQSPPLLLPTVTY